MAANLRAASCSALLLSVAGCAFPQIHELREIPPNREFIVQAPLRCLFSHGAERASVFRMSEPPFKWYINADYTSGWFRQALTLVDLTSIEGGATRVSRAQTPTAAALGQATDLMDFLETNPCASEQAPAPAPGS